jgi:hypothetical protein
MVLLLDTIRGDLLWPLPTHGMGLREVGGVRYRDTGDELDAHVQDAHTLRGRCQRMSQLRAVPVLLRQYTVRRETWRQASGVRSHLMED